MNPFIGIVYCGFDRNRQFVSNSYIEAVSAAGSIPVVIPYFQFDGKNCAAHPPDKLMNMCGGFLFCGGADVTPLLFGEEPGTDKGSTDLKTDRFQLALMRRALSLGKPILGICRGMQILNLALGGSLWQDISLRPKHSLNHMQLSLDRSDPSHGISVQKSSLLYKLCGDIRDVNSFHHQGIRNLGETLTVSARASDGIIEAVESTVHPFVLGVQWHPECMCGFDPRMEKIFSSFVNISRRGHLPL